MTTASSQSLIALVAKACGRAPGTVQTGDRLVQDLRLDSLELAGLLLDIENAHGVSLDASTVQNLVTVAHLIDAVARQQSPCV